MKKRSLFLTMVSLVLFGAGYAFAESNAPFFPALGPAVVETPARELVVNPGADSRATSMRYFWNGAWSAWEDKADEIRLPVQISPKSIGFYPFSLQYADKEGKRSAVREVEIEFKAPAFYNDALPATIETQSCYDWSIGYGDAALEYRVGLRVTAPSDRKFKIRNYSHLHGNDGRLDYCDTHVNNAKCPDVAAALEAESWSALATDGLVELTKVHSNVACRSGYDHNGMTDRIRIWVQLEDEFGFRTKPIPIQWRP